MGVFRSMREMLEAHNAILKQLDNLERKEMERDEKIILIFGYLKQLNLAKQQKLGQLNLIRMGFRIKDEK